jgi:hypothetical protein
MNTSGSRRAFLPARCASTEEALELFDSLDAIDTGFMLGAWSGGEFASRHPLDGALEAYGWHGKRFDSEEHVHPLLFGAGKRTFAVRPAWVWPGLPLVQRWPWLKSPAVSRGLRVFLPLLATRRSQARLRMIQFRGRTTAAMVYDAIPVHDVFRKVDGDTVLGLMDAKGMERPFFFLLRRER